MESSLFNILQSITNSDPHDLALQTNLISIEPLKICHKCGRLMTCNIKNFHYQCTNKKCRTTRNFFYPLGIISHKTNLTNILLILACFCCDISIYNVIKFLGFPEKMVQNYYNIFREKICKLYNQEFTLIKFDDAEIDESLFGKRKYNRGRNVKNQWVFGICDFENGGQVFFKKIDNRRRETLNPIILNATTEEAIVYSDKWAAYDNLDEENRVHLSVNHSQNYIDPDTGANTQRIESMWNACKNWLLSHNYQRRSKLEDYLSEYCYRYNHAKSFRFLWENIAK